MTTLLLHGPDWFFGLDACLEGATALIALFIFAAAYRAYKISGSRNFLAFSAGFGLLAISFGLRAATDLLIRDAAQSGIVFFVGYVGHIFLALCAYLLLIILAYKIERASICFLLFLLTLPSVLISGSYFLSFYGLSTILLMYIAYYYWHNCKRTCTVPSYFVWIAFVLITLAQPQFLLEVFSNLWYVSAHVTQFTGYLLLLFALVLVHKK